MRNIAEPLKLCNVFSPFRAVRRLPVALGRDWSLPMHGQTSLSSMRTGRMVCEAGLARELKAHEIADAVTGKVKITD